MSQPSTPAVSIVQDLTRSVSAMEEPRPVIRSPQKEKRAGLTKGEVMKDNITKKRTEQNKAGRQNYECPFCKKLMSSLGNLKIHQRIHTGDKPYKCGYCDRRFVQLSQLNQHQRVHTGEKPFTCSCGKSFKQLCHLQQHRRCHAGEKPFRCDQCGTSFVQLSQLQQHINRHHSSPELQPTQCTASRMPRDKSDKGFPITYQPLDTFANDAWDKIKIEDDDVKVEPDML